MLYLANEMINQSNKDELFIQQYIPQIKVDQYLNVI